VGFNRFNYFNLRLAQQGELRAQKINIKLIGDEEEARPGLSSSAPL
jgi:hypothetical protein